MEIDFDGLGAGDRSQFAPLGRMASPDWYCRTGEQFEMRRPE